MTTTEIDLTQQELPDVDPIIGAGQDDEIEPGIVWLVTITETNSYSDAISARTAAEAAQILRARVDNGDCQPFANKSKIKTLIDYETEDDIAE